MADCDLTMIHHLGGDPQPPFDAEGCPPYCPARRAREDRPSLGLGQVVPPDMPPYEPRFTLTDEQIREGYGQITRLPVPPEELYRLDLPGDEGLRVTGRPFGDEREVTLDVPPGPLADKLKAEGPFSLGIYEGPLPLRVEGVPASILCDTIALCAWAGLDPFDDEPSPWDDMPVSSVVAFARGQEQW